KFDEPDCHPTVVDDKNGTLVAVQCFCSSNDCSKKVFDFSKKVVTKFSTSECPIGIRNIMGYLAIASVSFSCFGLISFCVYQTIDTRGLDKQAKEMESLLAEFKWEIANSQVIAPNDKEPPRIDDKTPM
ncbi:hypothetical protein PFISCL1PPCAC_24165, partial [Pristionchus fissidentatus]